MSELSKLQIRAKVLSVISKIKTLNELTDEILNSLCSELSNISEKKLIFDIYLKEFIKMSEKDCLYSGFVLKKLIPIDYIQDKVFSVLETSTYSDEAKYKLVQLLRQLGAEFDYNDIPQYFDNPKEILDTDTKKLLQAATINPEAMLDFLDFVAAVRDKDRILLLKSLEQDYQGDSLANIIYPILYSDFDDELKSEVIEIITEAKSSLAIKPLKYLLETSKNEKITTACNIALKKLKLAGASIEKADEYFNNSVQGSKLTSCFTTIPDGSGYQAFLIIRIHEHSTKYSIAAVVINDIKGIADSFGFFGITHNEVVRITDRFYKSEGKYKVDALYVKKRIEDAINLTIKNQNKFPYEFICWNVMISDISAENFDIEKEVLKEKPENVSVTKDDILTVLTKDYTFRWFIRQLENEALDEIINYIYNAETDNIEEINQKIKENKDKIIDETDSKLWKERLINLIYLLQKSDKNKDADIFYELLTNEEYFKLFEYVIIQRSIFNAFAAIKDSLKNNVITRNIFRKQQEEEKKYDEKRVNKILMLLKKNWINE